MLCFFFDRSIIRFDPENRLLIDVNLILYNSFFHYWPFGQHLKLLKRVLRNNKKPQKYENSKFLLSRWYLLFEGFTHFININKL